MPAPERWGLDSLEIRRRNLVKHDEAFIRGGHEARADGRWHESLEKAAELIGWHEPTPSGRGRGIAVGIKPGATTGLSQSLVRLLYDGSAMAYAGTSDMGQGARTLWKQILADELGVDPDLITIISGDTNAVPFDLQTSASRSTVFMGNAVLAACEDIRDPSSRALCRSHRDRTVGACPLARPTCDAVRGDFTGRGRPDRTGWAAR